MDDATDFPPMSKTDDVAPVPRRIRGYLAGKLVLDTTAALYVWAALLPAVLHPGC